MCPDCKTSNEHPYNKQPPRVEPFGKLCQQAIDTESGPGKNCVVEDKGVLWEIHMNPADRLCSEATNQTCTGCQHEGLQKAMTNYGKMSDDEDKGGKYTNVTVAGSDART